MRIRLLTLTLLCSLTSLAQQAPFAGMLPADASGWRLVQPPRPFVGDDLFNMINGGAALYLEYGFDRAVSAKYVNNEGKTIDAEIYTMVDAGGASGIFAITADAGEQPLALGDDGELGEYFLVFRKGRHVVTVSGQNSDTPTMDAVKAIGRAIEPRIDSSAKAPRLVRELSSLVAEGSRPVYFRGAIAAGNFYMFAPQNVFNIREGVTGERDSTRFFVFRYPSQEESIRSLQAAAQILRTSEKYSSFNATSHSFTAADRDGNLLRGSSRGNTVVVVIGRSDASNKKMEAEVTNVLRKL